VALVLPVAWFLGSRPKADIFTLIKPEPVSLKAGQVKSFLIEVNRAHLGEPIQLHFSGLPDLIKIDDASITGDHNSAEVQVQAYPDAAPGSHQVTLQATAKDGTQEITFELAVGDPAYSLPAGWMRVIDEPLAVVDGKLYYRNIDIIKDGERARFVLIPRDSALFASNPGNPLWPKEDIATFYMMENKVWISLYRKFASKAKQENQDWDKLVAKRTGMYPVVGVVWSDARQFARWLGGERGNLPTLEQWDKAAGLFLPPQQRGKGPYQEWQKPEDRRLLGLKPRGAMPVDEPTLDISPVFHVRHMAGNGCEWTRQPLQLNDRLVEVRGQSYEEEEPLTYKTLADTEKPQIQPRLTPDPLIGFRVVIDP
jgi:hypothetical protein